MTKSTRNVIRLISVLIVLILVLMEVKIINNFLDYDVKFWFMVVAYALSMITYR